MGILLVMIEMGIGGWRGWDKLGTNYCSLFLPELLDLNLGIVAYGGLIIYQSF
jgi:hypothetical protein